MTDVWYVDVATWRGTAVGATHWYARIRRGHGRNVEVSRILTRAEAKRETDRDPSYRWRPGAWFAGWSTPGDAERAGTAAALALDPHPEHAVVLLGSLGYTPKKVLAAPEHIRKSIEAVRRDDWTGIRHVFEQYGLVVREGPNVVGRGAPPVDPDLPDEVGVRLDPPEVQTRRH